LGDLTLRYFINAIPLLAMAHRHLLTVSAFLANQKCDSGTMQGGSLWATEDDETNVILVSIHF
jgi:hypothetical protein